MVIGLNLNELLVAMKVWKSFDKGKVGMEEATKAVVDEWKNDSACTTHHHDPENMVPRCFSWLKATVGHHTDLLECELNPGKVKELGKQAELIYGLHEDDEGEVKVSNENTMTDEDWKAMAKNETTQKGKLKYVRTLFLNILQEQYWNQIHHKMLVDEDSIAQTMLDTLDVARDKVEFLTNEAYDCPWTNADTAERLLPFADWNVFEHAAERRGTWAEPLTLFSKRAGECCRKTCCVADGRFPSVRKKEAYFEMARAYIHGHEQAQLLLAKFVGVGEGIDDPEEKLVILESKLAVQKAMTWFGAVFDTVPEHPDNARDEVAMIVAKKIAKLTIDGKITKLHHMTSRGLLSPNEEHEIQHSLQHDRDACSDLAERAHRTWKDAKKDDEYVKERDERMDKLDKMIRASLNGGDGCGDAPASGGGGETKSSGSDNFSTPSSSLPPSGEGTEGVELTTVDLKKD